MPNEDGTLAYSVLGVRVDAVQIPDVIARAEEWIARRDQCRYIAVTGMHGVMEAQHDPEFKVVLNAAAMVVPDGMPLVWLGRRHGFTLPRRVYGPELMETFCKQTEHAPYRHFFYGGKPGVADDLAQTLVSRYPDLRIAGTYCPPFRALTADEDAEAMRAIEESQADIVWVGLSTPKQEVWMSQHSHRLTVPVLVGVGAAFDLNTGRVPSAPTWMQDHGLEWLFRLLQEPKRLWRRYLVYGPEFIIRLTIQFLRQREF